MADGSDIVHLAVLFKRSFWEYKSRIFLLTSLSFIGGILEGIGINAIIPLFSFISNEGGGGTDLISRSIQSFFMFFNIRYTVKYLLIFIIALFIIKAIAAFFTDYISIYTKSLYEKKIRNDLFEATLKADWPYLSKQKVGYLEQILTTDVDTSSIFFVYASNTIAVAVNLVVYSLLVVNISWIVALFTMLFGVLALLAFKPFFKINRIVSEERARLYKIVSHFVSENIIGMKLVKSAYVHEPILAKGNEYFDKVKKLNMRVAISRNLTTVTLQPLGMLFIIAIFAFFYKTHSFNFGSFAVIVYAINKVFSYFQQTQSNLHLLNTFIPYLESVNKYKNESDKYKEIDKGIGTFKFSKKLEFNNVSFSYETGEDVLSNINFTISKGEMVGLIGPSGAGKTTIVDLILRLLTPSKGEILLDGADISNISLAEWRKNIRYVSQDLFLLNDTIENNIRFYSVDLNKKDIIRAAKLANIYEFIESLPEKFDSIVGERGIMLSGGQRQRVILARVLARNPHILILDEATSALDNESEILIQKSIEGLRGGVTVLAIAHRLSTVKASDKLIVLDKGKVAEVGSPEELLKNKDSYFFKVYNLRT